MLSSLDKLSSDLSRNQFRGTRKYLELFHVQEPNQSQTNNVTEGGEEGEDYRNRPYQPPTLMPDQQQKLMTRN